MILAGLGAGNLILLALAGVLLDLAVQSHQVFSQREIYELRPDAGARINTIYMTTVFLGGAAATAISGTVYGTAGWTGVTMLGAGLAFVALVIWAVAALRRPRAAAAAAGQMPAESPPAAAGPPRLRPGPQSVEHLPDQRRRERVVQRFVAEQQPVVHRGEELVHRGGDVDPGVKLAPLYPRPQQAGTDLPARPQPPLVQCGADVRVGLAGGHQLGHQRSRVAVTEKSHQRRHLGGEDLLQRGVLIDRHGVPGTVEEAFQDHMSG